MPDDSFLERVRRRKYENGELAPDELAQWYRDHPEDAPDGWLDPATHGSAPDLIPDVGDDPRHEDDELQPYLDGIDILDAYARWCGKMVPKVGNKRESIKISCPDPNHPDKDPSAWLNLDKQVWTCGRDWGLGGDKYDLAAWHFGFDVPGYKTDGTFPELRRRMAEDFGYIVKLSPSGKVEVTEPEPEPAAPVVPIPTELMDESDVEPPTLQEDVYIDWKEIIPVETFLDEWMTSTTIDDIPHEFYFWMGMAALSAAAGNNVILEDFKPVKGNLFICTYGSSGSGKSRAKGQLDRILKAVMPYRVPDEFSAPTGLKILPAPGSSEALLSLFQHQVLDKTTMKPSDYVPVKGLLTVEEFSSFVAKSARHGNPMKETLIDLYDAHENEISSFSRSGGLVRAHSPYCLMITTTQPKAIHDFMRRSDIYSGFMNRFIFAAGHRRTKRISHGGAMIDLTDAARHLDSVYKWCLMPGGRQMELSGDALTAWDDFYHDQLGPLFDATDNSIFSRMDLTLKKVILLLTVNEKRNAPTAEIVERACKLFPYLKATYSLFSDDVTLDEAEEARQAVMKTVIQYQLKHGKGISRREIVMRLIGKHGMENIGRAIAFLETYDVIEVKQEAGNRGPKSRRYVISGD